MLSDLFNWVLKTSLMATVLVALILLVKFVLKDNLKVKWQYLIWFVLILRLMLPMAPESSFSMFNFFSLMNKQTADLSNSVNSTNVQTVNTAAAAEDNNQSKVVEPTENLSDVTISERSKQKDSAFSIQTAFLLVWLLGVMTFAIYLVAANRKLAKKAARGSFITNENILNVFAQCKKEIHVNRKIPLIASQTVEGPTLYGFIRPRILLPAKGLDKFSSNEVKYIFLHELVHFKRKDIFVNWLMTVLLFVHWFNPVLWYAYKKMREDQELSCDAAAISHIEPDEVKEYGRTIIKLLENFKQPSWAPAVANFSADKTQLVRRIKMITFFKKYSYRWSILGLVVIVLLSGCALTNSKPKTEESPKTPTASVSPPKETSTPAPTASATPVPTASASPSKPESNVYANTQYGFQFTLPDSWKGYSIVDSKWEGLAMNGDSGEKVVETGPMLSIRDPQWTAKTPRQDIPIMVFTLSQWNALQKGTFHIGAAPVGPTELGRNGSYVFALPARYNAAALPGYEEVSKILEGQPLKAVSVK